MKTRFAATGQDEMRFDAPDPAAVASVKDVEKVAGLLEVTHQMTAAEICEKLGWEATENRKRKVRAIARAAFPEILGFSFTKEDGSRFEGYKLLRYCSLPEAWAAERALESLERDIVKRKMMLLDKIHTGKVGSL